MRRLLSCRPCYLLALRGKGEPVPLAGEDDRSCAAGRPVGGGSIGAQRACRLHCARATVKDSSASASAARPPFSYISDRDPRTTENIDSSRLWRPIAAPAKCSVNVPDLFVGPDGLERVARLLPSVGSRTNCVSCSPAEGAAAPSPRACVRWSHRTTSTLPRQHPSRCSYLSRKPHARAPLRARALADGLSIATGVIEDACRYLVQYRMGRTGARWSLAGAEAVLRLRALRASNAFDDYWTFHLAKESSARIRDAMRTAKSRTRYPQHTPLRKAASTSLSSEHSRWSSIGRQIHEDCEALAEFIGRHA